MQALQRHYGMRSEQARAWKYWGPGGYFGGGAWEVQYWSKIENKEPVNIGNEVLEKMGFTAPFGVAGVEMQKPAKQN